MYSYDFDDSDCELDDEESDTEDLDDDAGLDSRTCSDIPLVGFWSAEDLPNSEFPVQHYRLENLRPNLHRYVTFFEDFQRIVDADRVFPSKAITYFIFGRLQEAVIETGYFINFYLANYMKKSREVKALVKQYIDLKLNSDAHKISLRLNLEHQGREAEAKALARQLEIQRQIEEQNFIAEADASAFDNLYDWIPEPPAHPVTLPKIH